MIPWGIYLRFAKYIGIAIVLAGLYGKGRHDGFEKGDRGRLALQSQIEAAVAEQAVRDRAASIRQGKINATAQTDFQRRLADVALEHRRLRNAAPDDPDGVPGIPDTAGRTDAAAINTELLDVLRAAEADRVKLEALQTWIRETTK